jgi:hypothetical protein
MGNPNAEAGGSFRFEVDNIDVLVTTFKQKGGSNQVEAALNTGLPNGVHLGPG